MLTKELVQKALPANLKGAATQALTDHINNITTDPLVAEQIRNNFISYASVLRDGKFKTEDYVHAVAYVSYKLMGDSNHDAYFKTFPQRYQALLAKGTPSKDIAAYVSAYNKGKLVNLILEQSIVPTWVLNRDLQQKAINRLADLMETAQSEKVQVEAAIGLVNALAKPKEVGPLVQIDVNEGSGMDALREQMVQLAKQQREIIEQGISAKTIAAQPIIDVEAREV